METLFHILLPNKWMKNEGFKNVFLFSCDDKRECRKKTQNSAPKNSLFVNMFFIFDRDAEIVLF